MDGDHLWNITQKSNLCSAYLFFSPSYVLATNGFPFVLPPLLFFFKNVIQLESHHLQPSPSGFFHFIIYFIFLHALFILSMFISFKCIKIPLSWTCQFIHSFTYWGILVAFSPFVLFPTQYSSNTLYLTYLLFVYICQPPVPRNFYENESFIFCYCSTSRTRLLVWKVSKKYMFKEENKKRYFPKE